MCLVLPIVGQQIKFRPQISIAYPLTYDPWKLSIFRGTMEKVTGWTIRWLELKDANKATTAMSNGECSMAIIDSAELAVAITRGANWRTIWVMEDLNEQEGLIVHNQFHFAPADGLGTRGGTIRTPKDLRGKRIGVWYGSNQHYALVRFLEQFNLDYVEEVDYGYELRGNCTTANCFFPQHAADKVTLVSLTRGNPDTGRIFLEEGSLWYAWDKLQIHAAWVGFPHLHYFKSNGTLMTTNADLRDWNMKTYNALVLDWDWYLNPGDVRYTSQRMLTFIRQILTELAKMNFYFYNNTKEFSATHPVYKGVNKIQVQRVDGQIAGVIGGLYSLTWAHLKLNKYLPVQEQLTCRWLGCGSDSAVAWSLRDIARFLVTVKFTSGQRDRGLEYTLADYAFSIYTEFQEWMVAQGAPEYFYFVKEGESIELGYHTEYIE